MAKAHGGLFRERYGHLRRGDRVMIDGGLIGRVRDKNQIGQPYVEGSGLGLYLYKQEARKISKHERPHSI